MFTKKHISLGLLCASTAILTAPIAAQADTEIDIYGYTKLDLFYDPDAALGTTTSGITGLTPGFDSDSSSDAHAFQSRLGVRTTTSTALGDVKTQIEGDFFGNGGGGFRLRHANGQIGGLLAGQTWSNFMPIESYPTTLDFQGPAGLPFSRVAQLRYTSELGGGFSLSGSLEDDPAGEHLAVTAAARYTFDQGFVKVAGISRQLSGATETVDGFGVSVSGNAQLWQGGLIQASYTAGEGIGSQLVFGGADVDGNDAIETEGYSLAIWQDIGEQFKIGAAYGRREIDSGALDDLEELETIHLSAFYNPVENVTFGVEYFTGEVTQFDGETVEADRIQGSVQFNF